MTRTSSSSHSAPRRREPSGRAPTRTSRRYSPIDPSDWALRLDSALLASGDTVDLDDSRPEVPDEAPPERVGRFRIAGVLGRGGMATVYRAFDPARGDQQVVQPARAAAIVAALARALEYLHGRGVVHRDLKPANVVLHAARGPVILDLGLAKDLRSGRRLTANGEILGTVSFMAPEQVRGGDVDARTDVYALGAVLFALITGRSPHPGPPAVALRRILRGATPSLCAAAPTTPPALDRVCTSALATEPARRPASAAALARALEQALHEATA